MDLDLWFWKTLTGSPLSCLFFRLNKHGAVNLSLFSNLLNGFGGPLLVLLQSFKVCLELERSKLDTVFQEFEDHRDADDAIYELNGKELCDERVTIEHARARRGRGRFPQRFSYYQSQSGSSGSNLDAV